MQTSIHLFTNRGNDSAFYVHYLHIPDRNGAAWGQILSEDLLFTLFYTVHSSVQGMCFGASSWSTFSA